MIVSRNTFFTAGATVSLGSVDGNLFALEREPDTILYLVNVTTGSLQASPTFPGDLTQDFKALGGLDGVLYGISGHGTDTLYAGFQPGGALFAVGMPGVGMEGLAGLAGILYGIDTNPGPASSLYRINTTTAAATLLGSNSIGIASLTGIEIGVSPAVRMHIIPNVRVDMWRPTGTTDQLAFYSESETTVVQIVGIP